MLDNELEIRIGGEDHKLKVPLPSVGERVFSFKEEEHIDSFLRDIAAEDPSVNDVSIFSKNGERISRRMPVRDVISKDWILKVQDKSYYVKAPSKVWPSKEELEGLHDDNYEFSLTRQYFENKSKTCDFVTKDEFLQMLEDHGLKYNKDHIRALHRLGIILHYDKNVEIGDKIILNPFKVSESIEKELSVPDKKKILAEIKAIEEQLATLDEISKSISIKATRSTKLMAWGLMGFLTFQWLLFARFTWWDFSWDVIEPVTYFTTTIELVVGGYIYYLLRGREYSNVEFSELVFRNRFRAIAKRNGFDIEHYENLIRKLKHLEREYREERIIEMDSEQ